MSHLAVINYVRSADHEQLIQLLHSAGWHTLELHGEAIGDKQALLTAASEQLFDGEDAHNRSSFEDLLHGKLWSLDGHHAALVWTAVHGMLNGGLGDLVTAADICTQLSRQLYSQDRVFVTFLAGDGPNFPALEFQSER